MLSISSLPRMYPPPENMLRGVLFAAGPALGTAVCKVDDIGGCITHSAALRKRSCTRDPPGKLGRPGFSTDIPLGGKSEIWLRSRT